MTRKFTFEWRITLLVLLLLPVLVGLGFWQLHRADHNRALLLQAGEHRKESPVSLAKVLQQFSGKVDQEGFAGLHLKQVALHGHWMDKVFLLENQIYEDRNGYYVFGVMQLDGTGSVLVNRGWIPAPILRSELPVIPPTVEGDEIGEIYVPSSWAENKSLFAEQGWPRRVGRINLSGVERELQSQLLPVMVRLREGSPSALAARWTIVNIKPEKNTAYAVQWFAMAFALLVCYGFYSYRIELAKK